MATTDYLSQADLNAALSGGVVNPEILQQIIDVSRLPLPFTDRLGSSSTGNKQYDWTMDRLQASVLTNAFVDGVDMDQQDAVIGQRVNNQVQIMAKELKISILGEAANSIGSMGKMARQVNRRGQEIMRDRESTWLSNQGAQVDDGATVPGLTATMGSVVDGKILIPAEAGPTTYTQTLAVQDVSASGTITVGGWDTGSQLIFAPTVYLTVVPGAITEASINAAIQALFENTGSMANRTGMSSPTVHSAISAYYFTSSARVATLLSDGGQDATPMTAKGAVNAILTDYGVIDLVPNALQKADDTADSTPDSFNWYIIDFSTLETSTMTGFRVEPLAKTGLNEKRLLSLTSGFKPLATESQGCIRGIDPALAMTA